MDTHPHLPALDPLIYKWSASADTPGRWRRAALASEALWVARAKEYHEMFIGGSLALETLATSATVFVAVKTAWRRLRFEVPELVVSAGYESNGNTYMQYQEPQNDEEINLWIERTISFGSGEQIKSFQELLERTRMEKVGHDGDQVFLRLYVTRGNDYAERVNFILNADHQNFDGIGIRILLGRFLALLAASLSSPSDASFDWKASTYNLSPPWIDLRNEDQLLSGPEYERVAEANKDFMFQKMPQNPGLPLLSGLQSPSQKTHFVTFTGEQSSKILRATKNLISPESNITHLGHAAMVLALLRANPPRPQSQTLHSPCWLNGRRYLRSSPHQSTPKTSYLSICQSFAPVTFSNLQDLSLSSHASRDEIKEKLIQACNIATHEYGKIKKRKSMLPECVVLFEMIGRNMCLKQQLEKSGQESLLPDHEDLPDDVPAEEAASPSIRTADPFFLSDGITEQFVSHSYFGNSAPATGEKKKVFQVDEVQFAANAERNLIVRMSSWRDRITVSGEWKECHYDGNMIISFLEELVEIMLSLLDKD